MDKRDVIKEVKDLIEKEMYIDKHEGEDLGGCRTVLKRDEYNELYAKQQATMTDFVELIMPSSSDDKKLTLPVADEKKPNESQNQGKKDTKGFTEKEVAYLESILPKIKSGATVNHTKFGKGIIIGLKDRNTKIVIRFDTGEKVFVFPDSFIKGFLSLE